MPDVDTGVPWVATPPRVARIAEARACAVALELAAMWSIPFMPKQPPRSDAGGLRRRAGGEAGAAGFETAGAGLYCGVRAVHAADDWHAAMLPRLIEYGQLLALAAPEQVRYQFIDNTDVFGKESLAAHMPHGVPVLRRGLPSSRARG